MKAEKVTSLCLLNFLQSSMNLFIRFAHSLELTFSTSIGGSQNENQSSWISFRLVNLPREDGNVEKLFFIQAIDQSPVQSPNELGISSILFALKPNFFKDYN